MIPVARLRELFDYNPETGVLKRLVKTGRNCPLEIDWAPNGEGYIQIKIEYRKYKAHRIVWAWMTGEWPQLAIDHINNDRDDNRWSNLRLATPAQNSANSSLSRRNTSGCKGVSYVVKRNLFESRLRVSGKLLFLGRFKTIEEASAAYKQAAVKHFGEYAKA